MVEAELIAAAQAGDGEAFEALARRRQDRIFWLARQVVGNSEDAKDVTQNVLVRLWRTLPSYDPRWAFSTWVHRMTVNLAIDHLRRAAPRQKESSLDERLVEVEGGGRDPEWSSRDREVEAIFEELRDLLPPQQRAAFALREIEGLSSEEIAITLDLKPSTVRNHLFQARKTLRRELLRRYPEYARALADPHVDDPEGSQP